MPPPKMPTIIGSTTESVKKPAMAASTALPPAVSISAPAAEANGWLVTTMPRLPEAGRFSQAKLVPARLRHPSVMARALVLVDQEGRRKWKDLGRVRCS